MSDPVRLWFRESSGELIQGGKHTHPVTTTHLLISRNIRMENVLHTFRTMSILHIFSHTLFRKTTETLLAKNKYHLYFASCSIRTQSTEMMCVLINLQYTQPPYWTFRSFSIKKYKPSNSSIDLGGEKQTACNYKVLISTKLIYKMFWTLSGAMVNPVHIFI